MDENKNREMETIRRNFEEEEEPIVKIWYKFGKAKVEVNGERIERMRSFEIKVSNEMKNGENEYPFYKIEQYLPFPTFTQKGQGREGCTLQRSAEQPEEKR